MPTLDQIHAAADSLFADGKKPTLAAVRAMVGGSYSTLSPALARWRVEQDQSSSSATITDSVPHVVSQALLVAAGTAWREAQSLAQAQIDAERDQLALARAQAEEQVSDALVAADASAADADAVRQALKDLQQQFQNLTQALSVAQALNVELRADRDAARTAAASSADLASELRGRLAAIQETSSKMTEQSQPPKSPRRQSPRIAVSGST